MHVIGKIPSLALGISTAVVAQKYGPELAGHIKDSFDQGTMGEYVMPIASKVGALAGVSKATRKFGIG